MWLRRVLPLVRNARERCLDLEIPKASVGRLQRLTIAPQLRTDPEHLRVALRTRPGRAEGPVAGCELAELQRVLVDLVLELANLEARRGELLRPGLPVLAAEQLDLLVPARGGDLEQPVDVEGGRRLRVGLALRLRLRTRLRSGPARCAHRERQAGDQQKGVGGAHDP
jgi:hypothetical protein